MSTNDKKTTAEKIQSGVESIKSSIMGDNDKDNNNNNDKKEEAVTKASSTMATYNEQDSSKIKSVSAQKQDNQPGDEHKMKEKPQYLATWYKGSNKLKDKVAIITGADSGIGRSVAILFAREGAKVVIAYLNEDIDANETRILVEKEVNNAGEQHATYNIEDIKDEDFMNTWYTKFFSMFWITQYALKYLKKGSCIINTSSVTAYSGKDSLVDYSATNGAIVAFTRSLALQLASKNIRVNSVAPGPIWTPLIPSTFGKDIDPKMVEEFGQNSTMGRPGQPEEVAPTYVFLASQDSSYYTGQTFHPNGGKITSS